MSTIQLPDSWDVVIAYVRFADNPKKGKARPILVYEHEQENPYLYAFKITSKKPPTDFEAIELRNWECLGLLKPSWLQLEPFYKIQTVDLGPVIGHASGDLIDQIVKFLDAMDGRK